ncbi:hypothetical protein LUZ63_012637 [Rhynchospora breviuscula]|uniref:NB-ARC domain-containing protein n=1 Tax=Rhynchospora breviuscula TaxID=2022672 RepID=A0A9Q0HRM3_9POAL|nr:hypothetical protein LUZ63_012637 [Rhynchospora breviuscula]
MVEAQGEHSTDSYAIGSSPADAISREIPVDFDERSQENEYYLTKLYESLRGKKYLIVLDDVWTTDLWTQIGVALPDELNGSRVVITTRFLDYDIDALQVIRMWVAEGFIPQEENRIFEDTAESFLEDLVQRGLIQATQRSNNGSIFCCRIHDLLRDVAIQKAKEENVLMVCSNPDDQRSCNGARRVAVHDPYFNELVKCASRNLRSLLCFGSQMPNCCEHGLLKVLYCPDAFLETFESLEGLTQLKYLNFRIQIGNRIGYFQGLIGRMRFMQTLDLTVDYANGDILENIWHIKTLRHVALNYLTPPRSCTSFLGPPLSEKQSNLRTLVGVTCRESWIQEPPKLPNLRDLDIHIPQGFPWSVIVTLLGTLRHLASLAIWGFDIPINIVNMTGFSFYEHLQNLDLVEWSSTASALELNAGFFPVHLNRLSIVGLRLRLDPMAVLETLRHLKYLNIWKTKVERMSCSATGFQQLEELRLFKIDELEELEIERGALHMLKNSKLVIAIDCACHRGYNT